MNELALITRIGLPITVCLFAISLAFEVVRLVQLHKRRTICFGNYKHYSKWYSFKPNAFIIVAYSVFCLLFLGFFLLDILVAINNIFILTDVTFALLAALFVYFEKTSSKTNRDLSSFDSVYEKFVANVNDAKNMANKIDANYSEVITSKNNILEKAQIINISLIDKIPEDKIISIYKPLEETLISLKDKTSNLSIAFRNDFNTSLKAYLTMDQNGNYSSPKTIWSSLFDDNKISASKNETNNKAESLINSYIVNGLLSREITDESRFCKLYKFLGPDKVDSIWEKNEKDVLECIGSLEKKESVYDLIGNKRFTLEIAKRFGVSSAHWWYLSHLIDKSDFVSQIGIMQEIAKSKDENLCYLLLSKSFMYTSTAMRFAQTLNDDGEKEILLSLPRRMVDKYNLPLYNEYELKTLVLLNKGKLTELLETCFENGSIYEKRDDIDAKYNSVKLSLRKQFEAARTILANFLLSYNGSYIEIDKTRLVDLYFEEERFLDASSIEVLCTFLYVLLKTSNCCQAVVYSAIKQLRGSKEGINEQTFYDESKTYLLGNNKIKLSRIVTRVEKQRQTLDLVYKL